jgi:flagellin-like protein
MRKGITPIISTIVLLLITVALAGAAWVYIGGFMGAYTEKSFTIPPGGVYCDSAGKFHVRVVNTGTTTITSNDWATATVEGIFTGETTIKTKDLTKPAEVKSKATAELTSATSDVGASGSSYTVSVGTLSGVQRIPATCP